MNYNEKPNRWGYHSHALPTSRMSPKLLHSLKQEEQKMKNEPDWEQVAHELAYSIMCLEEDCDTPKVWRKAWRALNSYEEACLEL
jgi:hypothetical protein